jgi:hypothetical protein
MADLMGDPVFVALLAFSSIAAVIVIAASMRMGRPARAPHYPPPPPYQPPPMAAEYAPHHYRGPVDAPAPQQPGGEPPAAPESGPPDAWVREARRVLLDLRNTFGLSSAKSCGYCGRPLTDPAGNPVGVGFRTTYYLGGARRELYCRHCGRAFWAYPRPVEQGDGESALEREASALAPRTHPGAAIHVTHPQSPPIQPQRAAPEPEAQQPPAPMESERPRQPAPAAGGESQQAIPDERLRQLSPNQLLHLLFTCGGCIHFNEGCTATAYSRRGFRVKRTHRVCRWWSEQRLLTALTTGRLPINTSFIDESYPSPDYEPAGEEE